MYGCRLIRENYSINRAVIIRSSKMKKIIAIIVLGFALGAITTTTVAAPPIIIPIKVPAPK